ncbi:DUF4232 domain-containing protein [Streptomyces chiangmaiensis]|uniref:DUF4232 domain-containing protein n=1 Tax=Streptomyces chiangmaiensis TaxID=766497 RepID=A0ABU7FMU3_9ACTN|nr:DUF4232 domain-containing protein [Streptomyces chiangmaiensis]MED7825358.1 DUF4232 domain-containing protein [Streptomyces chiangmaiensis]
MVTFRRGTAGPASGGTAPFLTARCVVSALGVVAALGLLTACGNDHGTSSAPQKLPGAAQPASGGHTSADGTETGTGSPDSTNKASDSPDTASSASATKGGTTSTRCHTTELRATVGRNNPGAGQENFPLVLTNSSGRTCTIAGYPGAAFVDASGKQLGPDPKRSSGSPTKITLAPGKSAWAGLTFSNPEVSEAHTATPTAILITPPDEKDSLKVKWAGGPVPVSGNYSTAFLTVFSAGTGA